MSGSFPCAEGSSSCLSAEIYSIRCFPEKKLDENDLLREELSIFWEIETISESEENVIGKFENGIQFNRTRYVSKLSLKTNHDLLPDSFEVSKIRLHNLKRRLLKEKFLEKYDKVFKNYEECGIIKRAPSDEIPQDPGKIDYLFHRQVLREDNETTKIRAVFDASCAGNGLSLNDCFYAGPNLLAKNRKDWEPKPFSFICIKHFEEKYYKKGKNGKRYRLTKTLKPVPTIFNPNFPTSQCSSSSHVKTLVTVPRRSPSKRFYQDDQ